MKNFLIGLIIGAAFVWVNHTSFLDELAQQELYCNMNEQGLWHDDPQRYTKICKPHDSDSTGASEGARQSKALPTNTQYAL